MRFSRQKKTSSIAKTMTKPTTNLSSLSDHSLHHRTSSFISFLSSCSSASSSYTYSLTIPHVPVRFPFSADTLSPSPTTDSFCLFLSFINLFFSAFSRIGSVRRLQKTILKACRYNVNSGSVFRSVLDVFALIHSFYSGSVCQIRARLPIWKGFR